MILLTGWMPIDPILSLVICALILIAAVRLLREGVQVVMEGVPGGPDLEEVRNSMAALDGVVEIHDLHIWQVSSERVALSAHVVTRDLGAWPDLLERLNRHLRERYQIDHPTLQPEPAGNGACDHHPEACRR